MNLRQEAREYLEKMKEHTTCCGVPIVRKMLSHIELHAGDCLSLDNEVTLMRDHWQEAEASAKELRQALSDMLAHMFGPDTTGKTRPQIEAQARAALGLTS